MSGRRLRVADIDDVPMPKRGECAVRNVDLYELHRAAQHIRETIQKGGMTAARIAELSKIARAIDVLVLAYLQPRIPGMEG